MLIKTAMTFQQQQQRALSFEEWEEHEHGNNSSFGSSCKEVSYPYDSGVNNSNDSLASSGGSAILDSGEYLRQMQSIRVSLSPQSRTEIVFKQQIMNELDNVTLLRMAKDPYGVRKLKEQMCQDAEFRRTVLQLIIRGGDGFLFQLSIDSNGNIIVQELIGSGRKFNDGINPSFYNMICRLAFKMACNRFACRILQKFIGHLDNNEVRQLLSDKQFRGNENVLTLDQNANHFVQSLVDNYPPDVYVGFVRGLGATPSGLRSVMEHKYGCRVIQRIFERVVDWLRIPANNATTYEVLSILMEPILADAKGLAENEYANYLVQFVIKSDSLRRQQRHIITKHLIGNILHLSQGKYSSHVLEQAFCYAEPASLEALFNEVLFGYQTFGNGKKGRTALHYMLFNQFGNYVVQRMIEIAIEVCKGRRPGKRDWLRRIAACVYENTEILQRYSSGQKILGTLDRQRGLIDSLQPHFGNNGNKYNDNNSFGNNYNNNSFVSLPPAMPTSMQGSVPLPACYWTMPPPLPVSGSSASITPLRDAISCAPPPSLTVVPLTRHWHSC